MLAKGNVVMRVTSATCLTSNVKTFDVVLRTKLPGLNAQIFLFCASSGLCRLR